MTQIVDLPNKQAPSFIVAADNAPTSVKASADYVGDGIGEQDVIQAAIDELPNLGGEIVLKGHFFTNDTIHMYRDVPAWFNLFLKGEGLQATTIALVGGSNCDIIDINVLDNPSGWKGISNIQLTGNKALQTSGHGIHAFRTGTGTMYDMRFKNVFVYEAKEDGFNIDTGWGVYLDNCLAEYCDERGLYLKGDECYCYGFHSSENGGHGIQLRGTEVHLSHSRITGIDTGIHLSFMRRSIISDNTVDDYGVVGGNKRGIYLGGNSYNNNIHDNIIRGGANSEYGFMIDTSTVVGGNNIHDNLISDSNIADLYIAWTGASSSKFVNNVLSTITSPDMDSTNILMNNFGVNPVGVCALPFENTNHRIMPHKTGLAAGPTVANTDYTVIWTPARIISTGGTGVAITIKDAAGTTIVSSGATCDEELEIGWKINFGNFSAAPSLLVAFK